MSATLSPFRTHWREIIRVFLKLGAMSPGGPGLIGILQLELQQKRAWLSKERFVEGLALVNMLPGPTATQLGIFLGYARAGWWGGLLAGFCFILPAFVIMLTLTLLYTHYGAVPRLRGVFSGLNPVVIGVFAVALYQLSTAAITDVARGMLALASALLLGFTPVGIVPILLLAGALGVALYGSRPWGLVATTLGASLHGVLIWGGSGLQLPALPWLASGPWTGLHTPGLWHIGLFFAKVGIFTFGGGLILLAFLQEQVVSHLRWLTPQEFLDGLAIGRLTPGPLPMLAAFIGYKLSGLWGSMVAAVSIFVPPCALLLGILPLLERIQHVAWLKAALKGIGPAIVGMTAVALLRMLPTAVPGVVPAALALGTVVVMLAWRVSPLPLLAVGGVIGLLSA